MLRRASRPFFRLTTHQQNFSKIFAASTKLCGPGTPMLQHSVAIDGGTHADGVELGQHSVDPSEYTVIKEGLTDILVRGNDVFYNKAQVVNRDLSISVLQSFVAKRKEEMLCAERIKRTKAQELQHSEVINDKQISKSFLQCEKEEFWNDDSNMDKQKTTIEKPLQVLEALAASGLRAIRYAREVEGVDSVVALDNDKVAVEACERNIKLNGNVAMSKVKAELGDARIYMLNHENEFDVVDIDPYGSPSIFLDSAVQCVRDGGLLMCTATDMTVLCGNFGEVCYTKYGSYSLRGKHCQEMAIRILLSCIESHANRYKRHIVPLLSVSIDFYVRVFVRIYKSPIAVKDSPSKLSYVNQCVGCDSFFLQPVGRVVKKDSYTRYMPGTGPVVSANCQECGKHFEIGGPIWSDPIHDPQWISTIYRAVNESKGRYPAYEQIKALLTTVSEELLDVPLFIDPHSLSNTLKCVCPSTTLFCSALANAGYRSSCSHASPLALKTDAPMNVIWDIMRCWVKLHPVKRQPDGTPGHIILSKEPVLQADFSRATRAERKAPTRRFLPNPEENWGPKSRAGRKIKLQKEK